MNEQKQLLCTFSNSVQYMEVIKELPQQYTLIDNKIFIFANENNLRELYKNSIILTNEIGVKIVPLKLFSIQEI